MHWLDDILDEVSTGASYLLHSLAYHVSTHPRDRRDSNDFAESMEGLSDREAAAQPAASSVAANIVRSAM